MCEGISLINWNRSAHGLSEKTSLITQINLCTWLTFDHMGVCGLFLHFLNENYCIPTQINSFICQLCVLSYQP